MEMRNESNNGKFSSQVVANQDSPVFEGPNSTLTLGIYSRELKIQPWKSLKAYYLPHHLYKTWGKNATTATIDGVGFCLSTCFHATIEIFRF